MALAWRAAGSWRRLRAVQPSPASRDSSGLTRRTVDAMAWMGASVGLQVAFKLVVTAILARLLSPQDFGVLAAVMMLVGFANHVVFTGIGQALVQRETVTAEFRFALHLLCLVVGAGLTLAAWLGGPVWTEWMRVGHAAGAAQALGLIFIVRALAIVPEYELSRNFEFRFVAKLDFVSYVLGFGAVCIAGALLGWGYWALIAGAVCNSLLRTLAILGVAPMPKAQRVGWGDMQEATRAAVGFSGVNIINAVAADIDALIVARTFGPVALGLYDRAYNLMKYPASLYMKVFGRVALAAFSVARDDAGRLARGYLKGSGLMALGGLVISALLFVLSAPIIHLLLGGKWGEMILPFQIFCGGMYFRLAFRLPTAALQAVGRLKLVAALHVVYLALIVLGSLAGLAHGLPGVAAGVTLALVLNYLIFTACAARWVGFGAMELLRAHVPGLSLSLVCLIAGIASTHLLAGMPDPVILLGGGAAMTLALLLAIRVSPGFFLGAAAVDFLGRLLKRVPSGRKIGRLLGVALNPAAASTATGEPTP
ncbi:MAG TPA: lipopolysaccharide biosynthesis protein [Solimonas sp.]|nr:lipopolysaccharide biosynthesis protein [Solimonas sp.]